MLADDDQLLPVAAMFSRSSSDYFRFDSVAVGSNSNMNVTSFPFGAFIDLNHTTLSSALTAGNDAATLRSAAAFLDDKCDRFKFVVNTVIIGALCVFGFAGNTLSMVILQRDRHNRVAVFLLQSLAAADNSVLIMSLLILSVFYGLLPVTGSCGGETVKRATPYMIKYVNPVGYVAQSCAIWITVLLAVNRYVAVCRPYDAPRWLTLRRTRIQVLIVVVVSVILNIPRIFQFDIDPYPGNVTIINVSQPLYHYSELGLNVYFETIYLNAFYTSVVLVLPLLLVVGLNVGLVRRLQASKRRMQHNSLVYSGSSENSITAVMVAIVLELVLCHTPDRILQIVRYINSPKGATNNCPHPIFYAVNVANLLIIISSSTNFIIYFVFRRRFRRAVADRLACCGDRARSGLRRSSSLLSSEREQLPTSRLSNGSLGSAAGHRVNGARGGNCSNNHHIVRISSEPVGVTQRTHSDSDGPLTAVKAHLLNRNRSTSIL